MDLLAQYRVLEKLKIQTWLPRKSTDFSLSSDTQPVCIGAKCLVLLPALQQQEHSAETKILRGMLSVLALPASELSLFWFKGPLAFALEMTNWPAILAEIISLMPKTVLVMGETLAQGILQKNLPLERLRNQIWDLEKSFIKLQVTYQPSDLMTNPIDKPKAFADLHQIKRAIIHD